MEGPAAVGWPNELRHLCCLSPRQLVTSSFPGSLNKQLLCALFVHNAQAQAQGTVVEVMKVNQNLTITGERVQLVPYRREHVAKYHAWMKDPAIQEATASEPLTLDEEYEMQQSWAQDEDKLTFILIDLTTGASHAPLCGDVNMFLNDEEGNRSIGEIEIMIAEPASRRKGIAQEALTLFMAYTHHVLGVKTWIAKIGMANSASVSLFQRLGFVKTKEVACFQEVHYALNMEEPAEASSETVTTICKLGPKLVCGSY